jgi:hypothetical protein
VVKAAVGRAPVRGRSGLRIGARRSGGGAVGGGEEDNRAGSMCQREWAGWAGWAGQRPRSSGGGGPMGGERGVDRPGWKERWAAAASNPKPGQNSKRNSFQISFDFRI